MTGESVRCVVVRLGRSRARCIGVLAARPWYETVAVVDVSADAWAALPDTAGYSDLASALAETSADAVPINPFGAPLHADQTGARGSLHVLVAKPITNDFKQACELVELAADTGV